MFEIAEKIVFKPPTELVPDEYEHFLEGKCNIKVHTFTSNNKTAQDDAKQFVETLNIFGYEIENENQHCLDTDNFCELVDGMCRDSNSSGLILFFSFFCNEEGTIGIFDGKEKKIIQIQDVVKKFTSYTCPGLKNKPKIFIFRLKPLSLVQPDAMTVVQHSYSVTYDTPGEADLFIIYKKEESSSTSFVNNLCANIKEYGETEDIISLVTYVECASDESRPLIVSTATRKFYFSHSPHRGHHFHIHKYNKHSKENLDEIRKKLAGPHTGKARNSSNRAGVSLPKIVRKTKEVTKEISENGASLNASRRPESLIEADNTRNGDRLPQTANGNKFRNSQDSIMEKVSGNGSRNRPILSKLERELAKKGGSNQDLKPKWRY